MKKIYCLAIFLSLVFSKAEATDISAIGSWSETIDSSDLQAGAGSDLIVTYESASGAVTLIVSNATGIAWRIDAKRTDTSWHGDYTLLVKRTSSGTGNGSISGGLSYIQINTIDASFFSGTADRSTINLQLELTGMSIGVAPDSYSTTVTYTVVEECTITTQAATSVAHTSAALNMAYDFKNYGSGYVQFAHKPSGGSWSYTTWVAESGSGTYAETVSGLSTSTLHYFKARIKYDSSEMEGAEESFTTTAVPPPPEW